MASKPCVEEGACLHDRGPVPDWGAAMTPNPTPVALTSEEIERLEAAEKYISDCELVWTDDVDWAFEKLRALAAQVEGLEARVDEQTRAKNIARNTIAKQVKLRDEIEVALGVWAIDDPEEQFRAALERIEILKEHAGPSLRDGS